MQNVTGLPEGDLSTAGKIVASWTRLVGQGKKHTYEGTVPLHVKLQRRKKNKAARIARRINR